MERALQWRIQGIAMVQLKPSLKIARAPNLLTSRRVGDKIATSYTVFFFWSSTYSYAEAE